jgi:hypothetical protein
MRIILLLSLVWAQILCAEEVRPILSAPGGRFVFGQVSHGGNDQYLLDTVTGRLWNVRSREGDRVLVPVRFVTDLPGVDVATPDLSTTNSPMSSLMSRLEESATRNAIESSRSEMRTNTVIKPVAKP